MEGSAGLKRPKLAGSSIAVPHLSAGCPSCFRTSHRAASEISLDFLNFKIGVVRCAEPTCPLWTDPQCARYAFTSAGASCSGDSIHELMQNGSSGLSTQQANEAVSQQLTGSRTRQAIKWPHLASTGERHMRLDEIESAGDRTLALEGAVATCPSWELRHQDQTLERLGAELTLRAQRYAGAKRALDIIGSLVLATVFSPLMLAIVLVLRRNGGPVIYRHWRVGRGGRIFECVKFRTMIPDADQVLRDLLEQDSKLKGEWVRSHKLRCDPRVTRLGKFLRRTSLDELPQLWNVIRGEMSLVGPRPVVRHELLRYGRSIPAYLSIKPGITGLWQVKGRNDTDYRRRVALDTYYVRRQSLLLDLYILLQTTRVVVGGRGAY